jgi:hypothetical protein
MSDHEVICAMAKYGGGFVRALANAAHLADKENLQRIKDGWPDYWQEYSQFTERESSKLTARSLGAMLDPKI